MPRLWNDTIEAHRQAVRDAILDATWSLATKDGVTSVTMSRIAKEADIGRATLYKYFADVETILHAWHERQITEHLRQLADIRDQATSPSQRLEAVLQTYATIVRHRGRHDGELRALMHGAHHGGHAVDAERQLHDLVRDLLAEGAAAGHVRQDVAADELAGYCLNALNAAGALPSAEAVGRLVEVTLAGLRPGS